MGGVEVAPPVCPWSRAGVFALSRSEEARRPLHPAGKRERMALPPRTSGSSIVRNCGRAASRAWLTVILAAQELQLPFPSRRERRMRLLRCLTSLFIPSRPNRGPAGHRPS